MTDELDDLQYSLINNRLPQSWANVCYSSLKPLGSWLEDLSKRIEGFQSWIDNGLPNMYWISSFFFPQGFLTSVLQHHARKIKWPIDSIKFQFMVIGHIYQDTIRAAPLDGCYVNGLFAEGFKFIEKGANQVMMDECDLGTKLSPAPIIHFIPQLTIHVHNPDISVPVYQVLKKNNVPSSSSSSNFVADIKLTANKNQAFWTL